MSTDEAEPLERIDNFDAEELWHAWVADGDDDILARAAFERAMRAAIGPEDDGLYFRPGGWVVNLPATAARIACVAAVLAASFQIANIDDVDTEIILAAAGLVAAGQPPEPAAGGVHVRDRIRGAPSCASELGTCRHPERHPRLLAPHR